MQNRKILIIDDVEDNREVIKLALRYFKYEFFEAENGLVGYEKAKAIRPDIIILDILMPIMDGFETIQKLKQDDVTSRIPIVILTSFDDLETKIKALNLGATDFLTKPFEKTELRVRINSLVEIYGKFFAKEKELSAINDNLEKLVQEKTEALAKAYYIDDLTTLYNRKKMLSDTKGVVSLGVVVLDIDNFGELNNLYGDEVGDALLKELAMRLTEALDRDLVYRSCADSFIIATKETETNDELTEFCKKLYAICCEKPYFALGGYNVYISVALGACAMQNDSEQALLRADSALEQAKRLKKPYFVCNEDKNALEVCQKNIEWTSRINAAIKNDGITPVFQPIVDNKTKQIAKYEALVRLRVDDDLIPPIFFLDIAKKIKLYPMLTRIMIDKTYAKFKNLPFSFSVNLSSQDIADAETLQYIVEKTKEFSEPQRIVFEILESEGINNYEEVKKFISQIKQIGCSIAIDDFGTGYSNFMHLLKLDVDILKIDGSLIKELPYNDGAAKIVKTIVAFAKDLGIKTVAEFVLNEEVANAVVMLDIDFSQGYYYGKPS